MRSASLKLFELIASQTCLLDMAKSKRHFTKPLFFIVGLSLSSVQMHAEVISCKRSDGKQALRYCYGGAIPLGRTKLTEGQELTDSYRCGTRLLYPGMTIKQVQQFCPVSQQPDTIEHYLQSFEIHHRNYYGVHYVSFETFEMERWTFQTYGRFRTYVIFRDGMIYQIIQDRSIRD